MLQNGLADRGKASKDAWFGCCPPVCGFRRIAQCSAVPDWMVMPAQRTAMNQSGQVIAGQARHPSLRRLGCRLPDRIMRT